MPSTDVTLFLVLNSKRFCALWLRQQGAHHPDNSAEIYQQLIDAYKEPQRVYHRLGHIENCLAMFDQTRHLLDNPDAVELAIWFHDVIYQLGAKDNEQLSADLFMTLTEAKFNDDFRNLVYQHIMATCHNCSVIDNVDTKLMVDIDLSSFGLPWPDFLIDNSKVQAEIKCIPGAECRNMQISFLLSLLNKPRFFHSDYFYEHYETQAQSNLTNLIELVKQ